MLGLSWAARAAAAAGLLAGMTASTPAFAWGAEGHSYVGDLAFSLLNPAAAAEVTKLLGPNITLGDAAVWPDCVRSFEGTKTALRLNPKAPISTVCKDHFLDGGAEQDRMKDYAARNWDNCPYSGKNEQCHKAFHFADINIHTHSDYKDSYFGAHPWDVVQTIHAAMAVLQDCDDTKPCEAPKPYNIKDRREALFLLAHMVGDVHQPLHVGAVYLCDNQEGGDSCADTIGGNILLRTPGSKGSDLHAEWDGITKSMQAQPTGDTLSTACAKVAELARTPTTPEEWATESVKAAMTVYTPLQFKPDPDPKLKGYRDLSGETVVLRTTQSAQLLAAGERLAALLNSRWPSPLPAQACESPRMTR